MGRISNRLRILGCIKEVGRENATIVLATARAQSIQSQVKLVKRYCHSVGTFTAHRMSLGPYMF